VNDSATPPGLGRVGGFELLLELAAGGMATVYLGRAVDGRNDLPIVAIKRPHRHLATDKMFLSMIIDEARLASTIGHPHVVKVRELGFEGGEPFVVMDYVEGIALSDLRKALAAMERAIDPKIALRIVLDALAGLHAAHEQRDEAGKHLGIIHRDVSPHNIIVGCDGSSRLTDFGIAKAEDRVQITRTHEVKGKLAYLAPERVDRRRLCTVQSDIFSMAVVLWECIAGRRLFRGDEAVQTLQEVMSAPIPRLRQVGAPVSAALDDVIARALSRDLETRHLTAADLGVALERAAGKDGVGTRDQVSRIVEAVFGDRMAGRHEALRRAAPGVDVDELLARAGAPRRAKPKNDDDYVAESTIASLAPPAPSTRYTFGEAETSGPARFGGSKTRRSVMGAVVAGALLGVGIAIVVVTRTPRPPATPSAPAAVVVLRRVVVPLPFVAARVSFDDVTRELEPPTDVVTFEVPREAGFRHRLVAVAADGARAEGVVVEDEGMAKVDDDGFAVSRPDVPASGTAAPRPGAGSVKQPPIGTKKRGFTKLP